MNRKRSQAMHEMVTKKADVLVIGGGITGAGIALDAQSRGLTTYLVEMQDFAAGTSSRSTKLIHGGLRYLKQLQLGVVAETGRERKIVYENAPHITRPQWMLLPIFQGGTYGKVASSMGIWLYDYLAKVHKKERRRMLSREETLRREPLLKKDGLKGAGYYVEYRTDDARLTVEVIKKAISYGAIALNYIKVEELINREGVLRGVQAVDCLTGKGMSIYAKKIVNATGPWADILREQDGPMVGKSVHWTKGVHIVVDQGRFPLRQATYFDVSDGRMIFAIPRDNKIYIGTTDTNYEGELLHPQTTNEDREYLLQAVNEMFPGVHLARGDIESDWAGIRPLIHQEGKPPSEISRKDEVFHSKTGLITIAGGKLTGYRKMAEKVVDHICAEMHQDRYKKKPKKCITDKIILSGGDVGGISGWNEFVEKYTGEGMQRGLSRDEARSLTHRYGSNITHVYKIIDEGNNMGEEHGLSSEVYGSLVYGLEHEMIQTPLDYFIRRTGSAWFDIGWVMQWQGPVMQFMKKHFGWNDFLADRYMQQMSDLLNERK